MHIESVCKKISKTIFLLRKLKLIVSVDVLISVYFAHLQSHLMYGILVWGNDSNVKRLLILQKRAIRIICGVNSRCHCKPLFKQLNVLTVTSLYILECLMYVKSNLPTIPTNSLVHNHNTRFSEHLRLSQCNYRSTIKSSFEFSLKLYNMLPLYLKNLNAINFKKQVKGILLLLSVYTVEEFIDYCASV
jgi:hypothetical protein